jgi:hypothetical protein
MRSGRPRELLGVLSAALVVMVGGPIAASPGPASSPPTRQAHPAATATASPTPSPTASTSPAGPGTWFFNWYDRLSPGMANDNIHLVNPGAAAISGNVTLAGNSQAFSIAPGAQMYLGFGAAIGGPVVVSASGPVVASQRVTYFRSFSEIKALSAADAVAVGWFPWYDNASGGTIGDNLHFLNPDPAAIVDVTATVAGQTITATVPPLQEVYRNFPAGTIGGPVKVTTRGGPILASQRAQYGQSFNELPALGTPAAPATLISNWYDNISPGMTADNVHLVDVDTVPAQIGITLNGALGTTATIQPGAEFHWSFPAGTINGPLQVTSNARIVGTQRVTYYGAFQEFALQPAGVTDAWYPWYDNASPCFLADNVHVTAAAPGTSVGSVTLPGKTPLAFSVAFGKEAILDFPGGSIGGPVHVAVTGGPPVVVDKRVVVCPPPPPPPPPSPRHIVVSLAQQHLWAYDHDRLILETDVTTGRPELPTPPGHYTVFYKTTPYEMISPWPPGSPFWYPNAWVSWVMEFKGGGYFLHDAPWRGWFGPDSNVYDGTHGCINIPYGAMQQLFSWAQLGDPVDVNVN